MKRLVEGAREWALTVSIERTNTIALGAGF